jgi:oligoribonuclease (3'-5' exoribonuclease)
MATKMDIAKVIARGTHEGFTAYMVATLVNAELVNRGLEEIRPQMMYNYSKNGLINGVKNQHVERGYTMAEVVAFVEKFATMRQNKAAGQVPAAPQTVEDIDKMVQELLAKKSELQGTQNA